MASMCLVSLFFLISSLHASNAQIIIGSSSSFSPLEPPNKSSPHPTKQTTGFWPSLPPRGRSDVPIRFTVRDQLTTANAVQQSTNRPRIQSSPAPDLSSDNLSSGPILIQPTVSRPRTDTASLAFSRSFAKRDATTKGSTPPLAPLPSTAVAEAAGYKPVAASNPEDGPLKETDVDLAELGSGSTPTVMLIREESLIPLPTVGEEMAQYQPQAQTAVSEDLSVETSNVKPTPVTSEAVKPREFALTTASRVSMAPQTETRATLSPVVTIHAVIGEKLVFC